MISSPMPPRDERRLLRCYPMAIDILLIICNPDYCMVRRLEWALQAVLGPEWRDLTRNILIRPNEYYPRTYQADLARFNAGLSSWIGGTLRQAAHALILAHYNVGRYRPYDGLDRILTVAERNWQRTVAELGRLKLLDTHLYQVIEILELLEVNFSLDFHPSNTYGVKVTVAGHNPREFMVIQNAFGFEAYGGEGRVLIADEDLQWRIAKMLEEPTE